LVPHPVHVEQHTVLVHLHDPPPEVTDHLSPFSSRKRGTQPTTEASTRYAGTRTQRDTENRIGTGLAQAVPIRPFLRLLCVPSVFGYPRSGWMSLWFFPFRV